MVAINREVDFTPPRIEFLDLFCGAGGSGDGILNAFRRQDKNVRGTFINHWDQAINIHAFNHPLHRHLCTGVDQVSPEELYDSSQKLNFLWGSPECTHHSVARGGKPMNEQSRATAWCLIRWIRHMHPDHIIVENVREFQQWGPLIHKRQKGTGLKLWVVERMVKGKLKKIEVVEVPFTQAPSEDRWRYYQRLSKEGYEASLTADPKRKAVTFNRWVRELRKLGYLVEWKVLCSADYGDPTTRRRLFVNCVRIASGKKVVWPNPTHAKPDKQGMVSEGLLPWVPARDILDLEDKGKSILRRKKSLSKKSLYRIAHGVVEFGLAEFILPQQRGGSNGGVDPVDLPVRPVTTTGAEAIITPEAQPLQEFILPQNSSGDRIQGTDRPAPALTTTSRGVGISQPEITPLEEFITDHHGTGLSESAAQPVDAISTKTKHGIAQPEITNLPDFVVQQQGQSTAQSVEDPVSGLTASTIHHGKAKPVIIKLYGTSKAAVSIELPAPTVTGSGTHLALAVSELKEFKKVLRDQLFKAFCIATDQTGGNGNYTRDLSMPVQTIVTKNNQGVVTMQVIRLDPTIIETAHGADERNENRRAHSAEKPVITVTKFPNLSVARAEIRKFIIPNFGEREGQNPRTHSLEAPAPAVTGHGAGGIVSAELIPLEAFRVDTAHQGGDEQRVKDLLEPLQSICGNRSGVGVIRAFIARFYSQGGQISSVDEPVPTTTTKARMGHVWPVLQIEENYYVLDVFFRMFTIRELARAQGFPDSYEFPGTKTDAVKAIGNSVSCGVAQALALAATSQNPDTNHFLKLAA